MNSGALAGRWRCAVTRTTARRLRSGGGEIWPIGHTATARPGRSRWRAEREGSQMSGAT